MGQYITFELWTGKYFRSTKKIPNSEQSSFSEEVCLRKSGKENSQNPNLHTIYLLCNVIKSV